MLYPLTLTASPLVCPSPTVREGTAWCDGGTGTSRFGEGGNVLCLAEPARRPSGSSTTIDAEVVGAGVCIAGKFRIPADLQKLADFVVSYDLTSSPSNLLETFLNSGGVYVPSLETLPNTGEFLTTLPLDQEGAYDISIHAKLLNTDGSFQDANIIRHVIRVAQPDLTVTRGRVGDLPSSPGCSGPTPPAGCLVPHESTSPRPSPGAPARTVQLAVPTGTSARSVELCVNSSTEDHNAGDSVVVRAVNTITDTSANPARELLIESSCASGEGTDCRIENSSNSSFCPGGFKIKVPVGHGHNQIDLFVNNLVTGRDIGAAERISIDPFDIDLKGPALCVNYLDRNGRVIEGVDNKNILASEAGEAVTVDVTLGTCGSTPESVTATPPAVCHPESPPACVVCPLGSPPDCRDSPVCIQRNDEKTEAGAPKFLAMCSSQREGRTHYQSRFSGFRFPMNTVLIKAEDNAQNETVESHSFGYGNVRALFDESGRLDLQQAMVPNGVGGFLNANFIQRELKPLIVQALNSSKFKDDLFFKLLDPHQPDDAERNCLYQLESQLSCSFRHLGALAHQNQPGLSQIVAIKPFCDGNRCRIGDFEIPSLQLMSGNTVRVQLKLKGWSGPAEMYTMQFTDVDGDSVVDTEDSDVDNDGICDVFVPHIGTCTDANHDNVCDEEVSLTGNQGKGLNSTGKCVLDKTIAARDCPDVKPGDKYFGCSDQYNNIDHLPKNRDLPGILVPDPDFGTYVIPLNFRIRELTLNLNVQFSKDRDGRLSVNISNVPGRELVEARSSGDYLLDFDCNKTISDIYQGGGPETRLSGQHIRIDTEACNSLRTLNAALSGDAAIIDDLPIRLGRGALLNLIHRNIRATQSINEQFGCTIEAITRCSTPRRLETQLSRFDIDKVMSISTKVADKKFHMDFFSPLRSTDVLIDSQGLGFASKGLLLPAGVTSSSDVSERDSREFMNSLPSEFKNRKFGPLSKTGKGVALHPVDASYLMGNEINLALNEETINSVLHAVNLLLWKQGQDDDNSGILDLSAKKLREDFGMAIPNIETPGCHDKHGSVVDESNWKCFPFSLHLANVFGPDVLNYVDFNGNNVSGETRDSLVPLILRNEMNPFSPPTVRIVDVTPLSGADVDGHPGPTNQILAELEIGMGNARMSVFEQKVEDWNATTLQGTGEIKNWCDDDRFPGANTVKCRATNPADRKKLPIVTFGVSGRVSITLLLTVGENGILRAEGGVSSVANAGSTPEAPMHIDLDANKTYLNFTTLENNTIVPDAKLAEIMKRQTYVILRDYLFGPDRDVKINIPAQVPLQAYCSRYTSDSPDLCRCVRDPSGEDCNNVGAIQDMWDQLNLHQFGIEGVTVDRPQLGVTSDEGPTRYLTIGTGITFDLVH